MDLCYTEDSAADTDMNVVMSGTGEFIEVQGTAEQAPFDRDTLNQLLDLAAAGCGTLTELQTAALSACRSCRPDGERGTRTAGGVGHQQRPQTGRDAPDVGRGRPADRRAGPGRCGALSGARRDRTHLRGQCVAEGACLRAADGDSRDGRRFGPRGRSAERTPGMPFSRSTARPESSAIAGIPVCCTQARAFSNALPSKVGSVSAGSG